MLNLKEVIWIIFAIIICGFIYSLKYPNDLAIKFLLGILVFIVIIVTNTLAKKIAAEYFHIKIETKPWELQRYWFYDKSKFKKPFPVGLILPFILSFFSLGTMNMFTVLQFDYKNNPQKRILKRRGRIRKTDINESDIAFTSAWGLYSLLILSMLMIFLNSFFSNIILREIARYSVFYGFWNLIPIGKLDGSRLFFGSYLNWFILAIFYLIFLILAIFI